MLDLAQRSVDNFKRPWVPSRLPSSLKTFDVTLDSACSSVMAFPVLSLGHPSSLLRDCSTVGHRDMLHQKALLVPGLVQDQSACQQIWLNLNLSRLSQTSTHEFEDLDQSLSIFASFFLLLVRDQSQSPEHELKMPNTNSPANATCTCRERHIRESTVVHAELRTGCEHPCPDPRSTSIQKAWNK